MHNVHTLQLRARDVLRLPEAGSVTLRVRQGRAWVTQAHCLDDWFLEAGQSLRLSGHRIVVEAETACEMDIAHETADRAGWLWRLTPSTRNRLA